MVVQQVCKLRNWGGFSGAAGEFLGGFLVPQAKVLGDFFAPQAKHFGAFGAAARRPNKVRGGFRIKARL